MKLGFICHSGCGGSSRIATELSMEMARRGHEVHLFVRSTPFWGWGRGSVILHRIFPDSQAKSSASRLITQWTSREKETFLSYVLKVIPDAGIDLLHFHYAIPFAFMAAELKHRLGPASPVLVGTLHGTDLSTYAQDPVKAQDLSSSLQHADALTTVSSSHARMSTNLLGLRPVVIPNFVDLARFHCRAVAAADATVHGLMASQSRRPILMHISNFRPIKDPLATARIFAGIRRHLDAELWFIGDGQEMDAVKAFIRLNGLEDDVRYWGLQLDVRTFLTKADLLLITSQTESFCLSALEAMACGVPVLAPRVGGLPELVIHRKTGFLFPPGDCSAAIDFGVRALSDRALRKAMGKAAAAHALEFAQSRVVSLYESLYEHLIERAGTDRSLRNPAGAESCLFPRQARCESL